MRTAFVLIWVLCIGAVQQHAPAPLSGPSEAPGSYRDLTERELALAKAFGKLPSALPSPTNSLADSPVAARLGERLFFDPRLSANGNLSCASCHDPEHGWADGRQLALGIAQLDVHSPSVLGSGWNFWQFWDGRADSLWTQAIEPIESPLELGGSRMELARLVLFAPELRGDMRTLFGELPDLSDEARFPRRARPWPVSPEEPFRGPTKEELLDPAVAAWASMAKEDQALVNRLAVVATKSIAAFERTLFPQPGSFDRFAKGLTDGDEEGIAALGADELYGWRLFAGKANCISCHFGPSFSDGRFHNLGLQTNDDAALAIEGRPSGVRRLRVDPWNGRGAFSDDTSWEANGKILYAATGEHLVGAFKTPSLRGVVHTAPYGHDGRFASLAEVVNFYSDLPGESTVGHREETLQPLGLSPQERKALVAFLGSLSGPATTRADAEEPIDGHLKR